MRNRQPESNTDREWESIRWTREETKRAAHANTDRSGVEGESDRLIGHLDILRSRSPTHHSSAQQDCRDGGDAHRSINIERQGPVLQTRTGPFFVALTLRSLLATTNHADIHPPTLENQNMGRELRDQCLLYSLVTVIVTLVLPVIGYLS